MSDRFPLVLRAIAEGRIPWAFWPPETDIAAINSDYEGLGIWLGTQDDDFDDSASDSQSDGTVASLETSASGSETSFEEAGSESDASLGQVRTIALGGRFAALELHEDDDGEGE